MPRFLFAALPATGHVNPLLPVVRELVEDGHEVFFHTGERYRERVEAAGAEFLSIVNGREIDFARLNEQFPGRAAVKGLRRFQFDMREVFIAGVPGQLADLELHAARVEPDVVVVEPSFSGTARLLHERHGIPFATIGISALTMPSRDLPPFGFGLGPTRSALGRARNAALTALLNRFVMAPVERDHEAMRAQLGAEPFPGGLMAETLSPYLYIHPSVPSFEYPRSDLPPQVHFAGPLLPPAPAGFELPSWWGELESGRPVVLVTQGTIATDPAELLRPTLDGLADEPVFVVAVTGGPDPAEVGPVPANARVERFVPFGDLMPHVSVLVTNGGYGGLHFGLGHGVPLVVSGATEEKPELVARVNWSGVGIGMRRQRPKAPQVRDAVRTVLEDPSYAARAAAMQAEMARYDGPNTAARLLTELAETTVPVHADAERVSVLHEFRAT